MKIKDKNITSHCIENTIEVVSESDFTLELIPICNLSRPSLQIFGAVCL